MYVAACYSPVQNKASWCRRVKAHECKLQQCMLKAELVLCNQTDIVSFQFLPQFFAVPGPAACRFTSRSPGASPELATPRNSR